MSIKALIPVYGSNRMLGEHVGEALKGCSWVGIPFAGGLCEVPHITARTIVCNDLNRAAMNLATVVADQNLKDRLIQRLDETLFHPDVLASAQDRCRARESADPLPCADSAPAGGSLSWAIDYFICSWMARNGKAGTKDEFDAGLSVRWDAGGGDSVVRFRNATEALKDWHETLKRATFQCLDAFDFLAKCKDKPGHGIYCDPDWPDDGAAYKHRIGDSGHVRLRDALNKFKCARVVVRYNDHALIRELYPEYRVTNSPDEMSAAALDSGATEEEVGAWEWRWLTGRTAANKGKAEVLLVNRIGA